MERIKLGPHGSFRFTPEYLAAMGGPIAAQDAARTTTRSLNTATRFPDRASANLAAEARPEEFPTFHIEPVTQIGSIGARLDVRITPPVTRFIVILSDSPNVYLV